jgi:hypothetical protein
MNRIVKWKLFGSVNDPLMLARITSFWKSTNCFLTALGNLTPMNTFTTAPRYPLCKKTGRTEPYWPFLPNECVIVAPICCLCRIAQFGIFRPGQPQRAFT